jgi:hypothetical protein
MSFRQGKYQSSTSLVPAAHLLIVSTLAFFYGIIFVTPLKLFEFPMEISQRK